jgi:hypothetical protein
MTWVIWRQYRVTAAIATGLLAAFGVLVLVTGLRMAAQWHADLVACAKTNSCGTLSNTVSLGRGPVGTVVFLVVILVPLVIGMFWGAPAVAREQETGTIQFAWVQSVTRRRWLTARVGWLLLAGAVFGGAIGGLATWWYAPVNALNQSQFQPGYFDIQGIVPIGYTVFAVALGICAGTLVGRSLPALAITGGVTLGLRLTFTYWLRAHYLTAITTVFSVTQNFTPRGAFWQLSAGTVLPSGQLTSAISIGPGHIMQGAGSPAFPAQCQTLMTQGQPISSALTCLAHDGYKSFLTYQPGSRFWPFQFTETAIFLALAAALILATFLAVRRRDA